MKKITLKMGTLDSTPSLDGWMITSATARLYPPDDDLMLVKGDIVTTNGDVYRHGECIANIQG